MNPTLTNMLAEFAAAGGTFAECKEYFGVATEADAYASTAKTLYTREGAVEFDEITVLSKADDGAYVMAWVWVGNSDLPKYHQFSVGDKVFWTDPDNGVCSGIRIVDSILSESGKIESDETVVLLKENDSLTEAFAGELSSVTDNASEVIDAEKQSKPVGQEVSASTVPGQGQYQTYLYDPDSESGFIIRYEEPGHFKAEEWFHGDIVDVAYGTYAAMKEWTEAESAAHMAWRKSNTNGDSSA